MLAHDLAGSATLPGWISWPGRCSLRSGRVFKHTLTYSASCTYVSSFAMYCWVGNFACLITFDTIQLFGVLTAATLEVCQEIALLADTLKSPDTCSLPPA